MVYDILLTNEPYFVISYSTGLPASLAQVMTLEVGKASHSGEEALGLKRYLTKAHSDQERLREGICRNREKEDFLMAHR